jgi:hypothetical protein
MKGELNVIFLLIFMLTVNISVSAQCDSLLSNADVVNAEGMKLNGQSIIKEVGSSDDIEISIVLSANRLYSFEVVGHKEYLVDVFELNTDDQGVEKRTKKVILNSADEKDGLFSIKSANYIQLNFHFRGIAGEVGKECAGILIYAEDI